ncbi:hypothetical protein KJ633_04270 [bacterium]|nr:hypothetical protein [bacterium]
MKIKYLCALFVAMAFFCSSAVFSADKISVAVMNFSSDNADSDRAKSIADLIKTDMLNTGEFVMIERSEIDKVIKEQKFQSMGMVDAGQAAELGKLLAVKKMMMGGVSRFSFGILVNVRVVDVETGQIEVADKALIENDNYMLDTCSELAGKISSRLTGKEVKIEGKSYSASDRDFSESYVMLVYANRSWQSDTVIISLGLDEGVMEGDVFAVYSKDNRRKGAITVKEVFEGYSNCRLRKGGGCCMPVEFGSSGPIIVVGDRVRKDSEE